MASCKKVYSNILQQNVYLRDCTEKKSLSNPAASSEKVYTSLDEVVTSNGVELRETVNPYPITPESVSSYAQSCDYKLDPLASSKMPARGVNLGDVTELQNLSKMSKSDLQAIYSRLQEVFSVPAASSESAVPVDSEVKSDDSEVKSDE